MLGGKGQNSGPFFSGETVDVEEQNLERGRGGKGGVGRRVVGGRRSRSRDLA